MEQKQECFLFAFVWWNMDAMLLTALGQRIREREAPCKAMWMVLESLIRTYVSFK